MAALKTQRREREADGAAVQYAALPYRVLDGVEVLLVTSRETGRWVIPKGWPMKGKKPYAAAEREALEEAGVVGRIRKHAIGAYRYDKRLPGGATVDCLVHVYPLAVAQQRESWREQDQRTFRWFAPEVAADMVQEPALALLLRGFTPNLIPLRPQPASASVAPRSPPRRPHRR
jgi:8-oxo-dGTP pyrophosphatase MutT (NUDIX family)